MKQQLCTKLTSVPAIRYALMVVAALFFTSITSEAVIGATGNFQQPCCPTPILSVNGLIGPSSGQDVLLNRTNDEKQKPDTTVARVDQSVPGKLLLDQNYPNPFRASTSIRYGLPSETYVRISIHTAIGPVIKVVVDERQAAGVYTLDLTIPELAPGIYFYRIQTEYGALTRRMTISR